MAYTSLDTRLRRAPNNLNQFRSFSYSTNVTTATAYTISAAAGVFALTGAAATFAVAGGLSIGSGSFAFAGQQINPLHAAFSAYSSVAQYVNAVVASGNTSLYHVDQSLAQYVKAAVIAGTADVPGAPSLDVAQLVRAAIGN